MTPVLPCTVCNARGSVGVARCPNCGGSAFVFFVGDRLIGWSRPLDPASISLRIVGARFNSLVNIILGAIGALGIVLVVLRMLGNPLAVFSPEFWTTRDSTLLMLWFGVFCLFLLIGRRRCARYARTPLPRRAYGETVGAARTPTGWEEARIVKAKQVHDASASFSPGALHAIEESVQVAQHAVQGTVQPLHVFAALLDQKPVQVLFARAGIGISGIRDRATRALQKIQPVAAGTLPVISPETQSILLNAYAGAAAARQEFVDVDELVLNVAENAVVNEILADLGVSMDMLRNVVVWFRVNRALRRRIGAYRSRAAFKPKGTLDRAMTAVTTPVLDQVGQDLTRLARYGALPFLVDREKEMEAIFRVIEGGRASVILVGEPGVGKDTIVAGIAERMVEEDVPAILYDKRLVSLSVPELIAGATPSEASGRLLQVMNDIARARNIVLAVENVDAMVGVNEGGVDLFDVFAQELSRGYFFCIATATPARYTKLIEGRPSAQAFQKVEVREPEANAAIQIIMAIVGQIEAEQGVFFTYPAIERSVTLSTRYLHERHLPAKAVEVLREAAQLVRKARGERALVGAEDVATIISEKSHVPVTAVTEAETEKLLNLEQKLHERVIGQDEAVKAVASALRRARAELRAKNRPISSFLFLGPTGVGKTELAKTVASVYFGSEDAMVRLDMSEYQESASIARLIGVPGEVGGGLLTEAIRRKPFTLLLLDEFEKAHPDILNVFLQVMEDGRLTDNEGRTIDFTNAIIVATSNAGSQFIMDAIRAGKNTEETKAELMNQQLKGIFKPELLNRFDGIIVFRPLTSDEIEQIAWLMMGKITDQLAERGVTFRATDAAVRELASIGFDPVFGARPMRRVIQEKVENALAESLLKQQFGRRDTVILEPGSVIRIEKAKEI